MQHVQALEPWPAPAPRAFSAACRPSLLRVVQTEILPRLLLAHIQPSAAPSVDQAADSERLATLAMGLARDGASNYLALLRRRGHSTRTLLLDLITPAARRLGALWEQDLCDFLQVTEGLGRLGAATRNLLADSEFQVGEDRTGPRMLIALAPGETHRLGAEIAGALFRFAGFDAELTEDFEARLAEAPHALLGLSISCDRFLDSLVDAVAAARAASLNRGLIVLVGGPLIDRRPDLALKIGADACVGDASAAVLLARGLLESRVRM